MLRKYNRIFILLNGKNEGADLNGSCDIEVINGKGRLYAYVGGIGRLKQKTRRLYLISAKTMGTTAVSAGELQPRGSNAVLEASFDPDNVFGSGMTVESINTAAIWTDSPEKAVLEGFVSQKTAWLKNLEIYGEKPAEPMQLEPIQLEPVQSRLPQTEPANAGLIQAEFARTEPAELTQNEPTQTEPELTEPLQPEKTTEADESENGSLQAAEAVLEYHNTFRAIAEKFRRELDMLDEMGVVDKSTILGESNNPALDRLFAKNDRLLSPGAIDWIKIDYREAYLIKNAMNDLRTIFVKNAARKARHMLAGRESGKYYIGVPGNEDQRQTAENAGFSNYLKISDDVGYWVKAL